MIENEKKGKNLFEVNGTKYIDNIPKDMRISLTKEQYAEYLQQKELIEKQAEENENLRVQFAIQLLDNYIPKNKVEKLIAHYKNEMESENDLLEQKIITREDYERRRRLHNNYIHILNKLLEEE